RAGEGVVLEDGDVVAEADEVGRRSVARPAEEAVVRREGDGQDHERHEDDEGGPGQQGDLEADAPAVASRPPPAHRGRRDRVAPGGLVIHARVLRDARGLADGCHCSGPVYLFAASLTAVTIESASPCPAMRLTTATLSALPMF